MFAAIKAALKYSAALPVAIELVEEINKSVKDDGSISRKERSKLMSKFWKLVKVIQIPHKKSVPVTKTVNTVQKKAT
tara:strand:+ start:16 stop:246 length:231 start_codon:yes stop_codon:yes gene_type:complete